MEPVSGISNVLSAVRTSATAPGRSGGADFTAMLKDALEQVGGMQGKANQLSQRFQLEDPSVSLEETMISMQKSSIGFQAVVQTRNKLVTAYNEIMNMQI